MHEVPDQHWWVVVTGVEAQSFGVTGHRFDFATCGASWWAAAPDDPDDFPRSWCWICYPGQHGSISALNFAGLSAALGHPPSANSDPSGPAGVRGGADTPIAPGARHQSRWVGWPFAFESPHPPAGSFSSA